MTCHNTILAKIRPPAHESPYSIELSITRQGSNQARSVEVRGSMSLGRNICCKVLRGAAWRG